MATSKGGGVIRSPLRPIPVTAAVVLLAVLVHGIQASALGLYWDDAPQLVQPLHALGHDPLAFILADTGGALRSERPLAYLAAAITRLAFLHGVAAVHWVVVALLTLNALAIAAVARRLITDDWFAFASAAVFLCYPLAPLQPVWAALAGYHSACLLALASITCIDRDPAGSVTRRRLWAVAGFGAYTGSLLSQEGFALIPPAFFAARWVWARGEDRRRIAMYVLGFIGILGLFTVWRLVLLPTYGPQLYPIRPDRLEPSALLPKLWQGMVAGFLPWSSAVRAVLRSPPGGHWLIAAAGAAAVAALASIAFLRRTAAAGERRWWLALSAGVSMLAAGALALAASPIAIEYAFGPNYGSRVNFIALPGLAIVLPALLGVLGDRIGASLRRPSVALSRTVRTAALVGVVLVGSLLHFTVKQSFVREWQWHTARLATLLQLAPAVADSSLIIIFDERDRRAPYADHYEMSSYALALYDNWSVLANTTRHLRFHADGVESTYHGTPGEWFAPGERGLIATAALRRVGRIAYDRVLLFRTRGGRLLAVADTIVTTEEGGTVLVRTNPARARGGHPAPGRTWRHLVRRRLQPGTSR
jgi:hypothetical protein